MKFAILFAAGAACLATAAMADNADSCSINNIDKKRRSL